MSLFLLSTTVLVAQQNAQPQNPFAPDTESNPIQKLDDNRYRLGSLIIDSKLHQITMPGKINMQKGMIELLAAAPGGKLHESVLEIDVIPYHLQVALLLLGQNFKGGVAYQGDPKTPQGDSVDVLVTWNQNGKDTTVHGEDLVWDIQASKTMQRTAWIFVGSRTEQGKFMADQEKSLITTYHDPFTIFDNPLLGGSNDDLYKVNEQLTPPKGTPVTVTIRPYH